MTLALDKRTWHPSLLAGQIVLVSSTDAEGLANVAPKSWITMVAFEGPIIAVGCNVTHATYRNVVATRDFVVNVVPDSLAERVWALAERHGANSVEGLTLLAGSVVRAPLVGE